MKNKTTKPEPSSNNFPVVGVGASAGGPQAFTKLLGAIPQNSGMAFVLVQHLAPGHESLLPEILQKATSIPVLRVTDEIKVEPDHIYIIPSDKILTATDGILNLSDRTISKKAGHQLVIDLFFTSLAEVHQANAIGVVLSGTATDGTLGLKAIKDHGGLSFAQDEATAQYNGMPANAIQSGMVDFILPPEEIPQKILEVIKEISIGDDTKSIAPEGSDAIFQILSMLRIRKGTDFSYYKKSTIHHKILRRMAINKIKKPTQYLTYLRENKPEQDILFYDLLIPVTGFFRDVAIFDRLCSDVFPSIAKSKKTDGPIRIWIAGCSTGEEAYSVAICFHEFLRNNPRIASKAKLQIFATDISEPAIDKARAGVYSKNDVENVSSQRLSEFFTKTDGHYQVKKELRNSCVFAIHNFLKDPPFSKMDLISCRNVLIYMEPYLQKKALNTFHYAINKKGFLLLGKSESVSSVPDLFSMINKHEKLFSRKNSTDAYIPGVSYDKEPGFAAVRDLPKAKMHTDFKKTANEVLLQKYTPPGVVVNESLDIVQYHGSTGNYLEPSPGKPNHNLLTMARPGLAFELRNVLHKTKKENKTVVKEDIPLEINGSPVKITIEALPLPNMEEPHYLVLFYESLEDGSREDAHSKNANGSDEKQWRTEHLEQELAQMREDMRSITQEQEAANEELQSANEGLVSGSEELQSLNEELETTSEELQSTNEDLTVVNQELITLNEQVTEAKNYSDAIVEAIQEPLVILTENLRVKSANRGFYKTFKVNESETINNLIYNLGNGQWNIPALRNQLENILPEKSKFTGYEVSHNFEQIGERTMLLNAREIINESSKEKLILLAIDDITEELRVAETSLLHSNIVNSSKDAIISKTLDGVIMSWNKGAEKIFGFNAKEAIGKPITILVPEELHGDEENIISKIKEGKNVEHYDTVALTKEGKRIHISQTISPLKNSAGKIIGASKVAKDISALKEALDKIVANEKRYAELLQNLPVATYTTDAHGYLTYYNDAAAELWGRRPKLRKEQWCGSYKIFRMDGTPVPLDECPMAIALKNGKYKSGEEFYIERPDGSRRYMKPTPLIYFDSEGNIIGGVNTQIDITAQVLAKLESEQLQQQKDDFLGIASHELKTPITVIKSYAQLLETILTEKGNTQEAGMAAKMNGQVNKMNNLIVDLLDTTKINSGKLRFNDTQLNFDELAVSVLDDMYGVKSHEIVRNLNASCNVYADKERIAQVIENFVTNAIKYSPGADKIIVSSQVKNKEAIFSVQDFGIGIDVKNKDKVFEQFYRVTGKSEPNTYPGIGLGLFISAEIIGREKGRTWVESEKGKGSVFYFSLPCL